MHAIDRWQPLASPGFASRRACEGHGPGRPRDCCPSGLPQIRSMPVEEASGSSRWGIAVLHTTELFRGDTPVRHGVLGVVPLPAHNAAPPSLHGVRKAVPPIRHYYGAMPLPAILSPHFVSFAWRYHRCDRCLSPIGPGRGAVDHPGVGMPVSPAGLLSGDGRVSQVPRGALVIIRPALRPRRDQAG